MENKMLFPVSFQIWENGGTQMSGIYQSEISEGETLTDCDRFIARHKRYVKEGNSVASLVICQTQEEFDKVMKRIGR